MTRQVTSELQTSGSKKLLVLCVEMEFSGALPASSSKKRPYGQGGMLVFLLVLLYFLSQKLRKTMI